MAIEQRVVMEPLTIDLLYKAELSVVMHNHSSNPFVFKTGAILGTLTLEKPIRPWVEAVDALPIAAAGGAAVPPPETVQSSLQALADTVANLSEIVRASQTGNREHF